MAKAKQEKTVAEKSGEREVIYDKIVVSKAVGDDAIMPEKAKKLLGWEETDDKDAAMLIDREKRKIFLANNTNNRPLSMPHVETLAQEIKQGRWRLNGESLVIGKTGLIGSGQHQLVALILAEQDRTVGPDSAKLRKTNPNPYSIEKIIVYGIDESDEVFNTLDTGRGRSLADVIYRAHYFSEFKVPAEGGNRKLSKSEHAAISKMCENAIRLVWSRTGVEDAFGLRRTHSESLAFLDRHKRIVECVNHIYVETMDTNIGAIMSPGYAAGLMYLMASSGSIKEGYYKADPRSERRLNFDRFDKAAEFWTLLVANAPELRAVREAIAMYRNENTGTAATTAERMGILCLAWDLFSRNVKVTTKGLELNYTATSDGGQVLVDQYTCGGIDQGNQPEQEDDDEVPAPAAVEAAKEEVKSESIAKKAEPKKSAKELLREKQEAEARATDAAKSEPAPSDAGFKAPVPVKPRPKPLTSVGA